MRHSSRREPLLHAAALRIVLCACVGGSAACAVGELDGTGGPSSGTPRDAGRDTGRVDAATDARDGVTAGDARDGSQDARDATSDARDGGLPPGDGSIVTFDTGLMGRDVVPIQDARADAARDVVVPPRDTGTGTDAAVSQDAATTTEGGTAPGPCRASTDTCAAATYVGSACADEEESSGLIGCDSNPLRPYATRTGDTEAWFRGHAEECSSALFCSGDLSHRVRLTSPAGSDFDLFVYSSCGNLIGQSIEGTGLEDVVLFGRSDSPLSDESFDYRVEVRHVSSTVCGQWSLTFDGR